jgi:uncharacterized membrane protein
MRSAVIAASVLLGCLLFALPASAKTLSWRRWDSNITIHNDGTFTVEETFEIQFIDGPFTFGYRNIPINKFNSIRNVAVSSAGVEYKESSSNGPNTFEWGQSDDEYRINWYFPPVSDADRVFVVRYDVVGGIAVDEELGDKFFWKAVGPDHDFVIQSSTVTITAPEGTQFDTSVVPATYGASSTYSYSADGRSVTVVGTEVPESTAFEVGLYFPHGFVPNVKPAWQSVEETKSVFNLVFGAAGLLVLVGGLVIVFMIWSFSGRDPSTGVIVPEYLTEPPSDLPPGLAGTLVDERADLQDIIATLVDLARRGAIDMEEESTKTFGIMSSSDFVFHRRTDFTGSLRKYEQMLLTEVFGSRDQIRLSALKNKFYSSIPRLQKALYEDSVTEGLFPASPQSVRNRYLVFGVVGIVLAFGLFVCTVPFMDTIADTYLCPFISIAIAAMALMGVSGAMPTKSRKGAEEAAKWRAFKEYLRRAEEFVELKSVTDQFDKFLPYAIAFGLDRAWIGKFARVPEAAVPGWYYPSVIPYHPHYHGGIGRMGDSAIGGAVGGGVSSGGVQDLSGKAVGSGPSLNGMSGQMFAGLSSMSGGLFTMLNSTASTFTSVPQSSSSGGGWSGGGGGGFSGGGGGGGGGAGFG